MSLHKQCKSPRCTFNVSHPLSNYCSSCKHSFAMKQPKRDFKTPAKDTVKVTQREIELETQRDKLLAALKHHQEQTRPIQETIDLINEVEQSL